MECGESFVGGTGELELDPNIVSEEAGKLYTELQSVVDTHGSDVVESLLPILVWVLEGLASCRSQLREKETAVEKEKEERTELLERYERERTLRRESQERYLELEDQFEQERRMMRAREKEKEKRERDLEKKAREQADQLGALEEHRASLAREFNTLKHAHNKLALNYRDMLEKKKELEKEGFPLRSRNLSKCTEAASIQGQLDNAVSQQHEPAPDVTPDPAQSDLTATNCSEVIKPEPPSDLSFINTLMSSIPELAHFQCLVEASTPVRTDGRELNCSHEEMRQTQVKEGSKEEENKKPEEKEREEEEEEESNNSLEWEMRNTDSVFSELSELSQEYIESVDQGVCVRGSTDQFEEILSQNEELKHTHELVDAARKALIWRVEELTNERSALNLELTSCRETIIRLEAKSKEMEEDTKRLHEELQLAQAEDPDVSASLPTSCRRFSRSEMARVVMEKNQYKERLIELQETVRRCQTLRVTNDESIPGNRKSVWKRFNRFLGLSKYQLAPGATLDLTLPSVQPSHSQMGSPHHLSVDQSQTKDSPSPRLRKRELYREIRSHVWGALGKRQVHGWSMPLSHTNLQNNDPPQEPKNVPVLTQLRLLDQRDASAKLTCAVAVPPKVSGEQSCSVWAISRPASSSDVTVIDPARSNTILDQFSLPPTCPALCICAVPPTDATSGTVWIGTEDGGVFVHSASASRRCCLQSVSLHEGVHSLTFSPGQVIAGLSNGTLAFFKHNSGGWDLQSHEVFSLGTSPLQPIRCCLVKKDRLWVAYWNKVYMIDVKDWKVEKSFTVSLRSEQQVRFLCAAGSGVWASCRLDPSLRLFDWTTGRPLQEVDVSSMITKTLGPAFLSLSPLQISAMCVASGRLWVGTGSGAIFSVPLSLSSESSIPYCSLGSAQLCFHGHRQAVKFIISAPDCRSSSPTADDSVPAFHLILSGGEGYINFRIGDDASDGASEAAPQRSERSHMFIWQSPTSSVPSLSL